MGPGTAMRMRDGGCVLSGRDSVKQLVELRMAGRFDEARTLWQKSAEGQEEELRQRSAQLVEAAYAEIGAALEGANAYVTPWEDEWGAVALSFNPAQTVQR